MLTTEKPEISLAAVEALAEAAEALQAHYLREEGHCYPLDDLMAALVRWLEGSIEDLATEALFHAVEGHGDYAVNRNQFLREMTKLSRKEGLCN